MTPKELARYVPVSTKVLREWLRYKYPDHPRNTRWHLTAYMCVQTIQHFGLVGWTKP